MQYKEKSSHLPDLTNFDFSKAPMYRFKNNNEPLYAEKLLHDETIVRSWGVQEMKAGDWILYKPSPKGGVKKSGIRKEAFLATYEQVDDEGHYRKCSFVRAVKMNHPFRFIGVDSESYEVAPEGVYFVQNLDKHQKPIIINGRRDVFFYKEEDLLSQYELIT